MACDEVSPAVAISQGGMLYMHASGTCRARLTVLYFTDVCKCIYGKNKARYESSHIFFNLQNSKPDTDLV